MKNILMISGLLFITACGEEKITHACKDSTGKYVEVSDISICKKEIVTGPAGKDGTNGTNGIDGIDGINGINGESCSTQEVPSSDLLPNGGAIIMCAKSNVLIKNGANGINGIDGVNGKDGADGLTGKDGTNGTNGVNGKDGVNGTNGTDGANGVNGKDGVNGTNGTDGIDGKDGVAGIDGVNGIDGTNGTDGIDAKPFSIFDPCKRSASIVDFSKQYFGLDEILLKTSDNKLIGAISQNTNGSGFPALSEVYPGWSGGWAIGGANGTYSCTFQYQIVTIDNISKKCTWFPNTAPTPASFKDSNTICLE